MSQYRSIPSRVSSGALLLDERVPGWYKQVDTELLDLSSPQACILGQTFRDFVTSYATDGFTAGMKELGLDAKEVADHGFDERPDDGIRDEFDKLGRYWKRSIGRRLVAEGKRLVR